MWIAKYEMWNAKWEMELANISATVTFWLLLSGDYQCGKRNAKCHAKNAKWGMLDTEMRITEPHEISREMYIFSCGSVIHILNSALHI